MFVFLVFFVPSGLCVYCASECLGVGRRVRCKTIGAVLG